MDTRHIPWSVVSAPVRKPTKFGFRILAMLVNKTGKSFSDIWMMPTQRR